MIPEYNVVMKDLPCGKEVVTENEDGSYTILINARLSYDKQQDAYQHALNHIKHDHFERKYVQTIEMSAHRKTE